LLKSHLGVEIVHVPYNGSPSAVASLLAGDTQIACLAPGAVMSQIQAGRLRALAVTTERRWPGLAQVPSFAELGMPQLAASAWIGIVAPAGTPASLIGRIHAQWAAALGDPPTAQKLRALGMEPVGNSPQAFAAFMREELKRWTPVIRAAAIAPP